jgi:pimeloyl-ACP methyl ester carboxylesterase
MKTPLFLAGLLMFAPRLAVAESADKDSGQAGKEAPVGKDLPASTSNLRSATLGGKQFWADELVFHGWRVQRHVYTGHYRLLDEDNARHASGTFQECRAALEAIKKEQKLPEIRGKVVLVLHGLIRTRSSMNTMCKHLRENSDFTVMSVGYASTREPVAAHARSLARVIEHLPEAEEIHFVAHSLGNIVIRHYLADQCEEGGERPTPRIGRIVMIAAPNQGSKRAEVWQQNFVYKSVLGNPGQELAGGFAALKSKLACPTGEFGVLAGGKGDGKGWKHYLDGDDDGTVSVSSTRLAGARDFRVVKSRHTFIMNHPQVLEYTLRFLQAGHFTTEDERQPVEENGEP